MFQPADFKLIFFLVPVFLHNFSVKQCTLLNRTQAHKCVQVCVHVHVHTHKHTHEPLHSVDLYKGKSWKNPSHPSCKISPPANPHLVFQGISHSFSSQFQIMFSNHYQSQMQPQADPLKYSYHIKIREFELHLTLKFLFLPSLIDFMSLMFGRSVYFFSLSSSPPLSVIHQLKFLTPQGLQREGRGWKVRFQKGFSFPSVIQTGLWQMHGTIFCFSYVPEENSLQLCRKKSNYWLTTSAVG